MSGDGLGSALLEWHPEPLLAVLAAAAIAYVAGALRARRWPWQRTASFLAGLAVLATALGSGVAAGDDERLLLHMAQHLLMVVVAPPLLLLGAPLRLTLLVLPTSAAAAVGRALSGRFVRTLLHPLSAWILFSAVLAGTHVPAFYEAAVADPLLHGLEHALYLWSALLLWQVVLAVPPFPDRASPLARMLLVMATAPAMVLVGATLTGATTAAYAPYVEALGPAGALADQQAAGALMWIGGSLPMAVALVAAGWAALLREEAQAVARERYAERRAATGGGAP